MYNNYIDIILSNFVFNKVKRKLARLKQRGYFVDFSITSDMNLTKLLDAGYNSLFRDDNEEIILRIWTDNVDKPSTADIHDILELDKASKADLRMNRSNELKRKCVVCGVGIRGRSRKYEDGLICDLCFDNKQDEIRSNNYDWVMAQGNDIKSLDSIEELKDRGFYLTRDGKIYGTQTKLKGKVVFTTPQEKTIKEHNNNIRICCVGRATNDKNKNLYYNVDTLVHEFFK